MKNNTPRQLRVLLALLYRPVSIFLQEARNIVTAMTGNANYSKPFPALVDVTNALDDLQAKIEAAAGRDRTAMAARNVSWDTARGLIRQLASYVQINCENDLEILLSSGFTATKTPAPLGALPAPENLRVKYTGTSGQAILRMQPVYGVRAGYTVQQAMNAEGPYTEIVNHSKTTFVVPDLIPGKTYYLRASANGAAGPSGWSNPVQFMAV